MLINVLRAGEANYIVDMSVLSLKMLGDIINQETFILLHAALHLAHHVALHATLHVDLHVPLYAALHLQSCVLHESNVWTILQYAVLHTSQ